MDLGVPGAGKDHYMVFHINETVTTQFSTQTLNGRNPSDLATVNQNTANAAASAQQAQQAQQDPNGNSTTGQNGQTAQAQSGGSVSYRPIQRVPTTIVLYMPPEITTTYEANWAPTSLGAAKDAMDVIKGGSMKNLFESMGVSAAKHVADTVNKITDLNFTDAASLSTRMIINNHLEVIFNGIEFRRFNFTWRFTPESEAEALNVDNIIRAFKFYAAPEILTAWTGRFWIYPAEFDIEYWANGRPNEFVNKISTCALINMSVNYTASGHWAAHRHHSVLDGSPSVCTDMTLTFIELELMQKQRILEGY